MKNIFPIFEEIYQGYCVRLLRRLDSDGNPKYSDRLSRAVIISIGESNESRDQKAGS